MTRSRYRNLVSEGDLNSGLAVARYCRLASVSSDQRLFSALRRVVLCCPISASLPHFADKLLTNRGQSDTSPRYGHTARERFGDTCPRTELIGVTHRQAARSSAARRRSSRGTRQ